MAGQAVLISDLQLGPGVRLNTDLDSTGRSGANPTAVLKGHYSDTPDSFNHRAYQERKESKLKNLGVLAS